MIKSDAKTTYITHYRECIEEEKSERPLLTQQITYLLNQCFPRYLGAETQLQQSNAISNNIHPISSLSSLPQAAPVNHVASFQSQPMIQEHDDFTEMIDWFEENNQCPDNKVRI